MEVRDAIDALWRDPGGGENVLAKLRTRNEELYRFEKMLEGEGEASISS